MTSLEKLKVLLYEETKDEFGRTNFPQRLEIAKELEKELKALDVVNKYIYVNKPFGSACYICLNDESEMIPEEEYELLKEVLL